MTVFEARGSTILYNLLRSRPDPRPFLLPANVCPVVPLTFWRARRRFRLVDIGAGLGMDADRCLTLVGRRPGRFSGLLYVRPYGAAGDGEALFRAARMLQPDLLVIDDRCLGLPESDAARVAAAADVTLFSTGRAKYAELGFGGFAHFRPGVRYCRHHADDAPVSPTRYARLTRRYASALEARRPGRGGTGDWLPRTRPRLSWAAYSRRVAAARRTAQRHKRVLNAVYRDALPPEIQLPPAFQHWRFNVLVPDPDRLAERLSAAGLFASRHYASLGGVFTRERFPAAEALHGWMVNLFNDRHFDESMAGRTAEVITAHLLAAGPRQRSAACRRVHELVAGLGGAR